MSAISDVPNKQMEDPAEIRRKTAQMERAFAEMAPEAETPTPKPYPYPERPDIDKLNRGAAARRKKSGNKRFTPKAGAR